MKFNDFDDGATRSLSDLLCIYRYPIMIWIFKLMVMLHSTTGPYGRAVIEVAYGEMIFLLHRGCMGDDSSGKVVGMSA